MSLADLRRLIQRATPRVEDVRSPDRTDIIRKEHGHLTIREMIDALDALEFSAGAFVERMQEQLASEEGSGAAMDVDSGKVGKPTAVHGLFHAIDGLQFLSQSFTEPAASGVAAADGKEEAADGAAQLDLAAAARQRGAEKFKSKDFVGAVEEYTAAIRSTPSGSDDLHTLYSNRSAAQLKCPSGNVTEALKDARRCVQLAPQWPKGYFREGSCLRQGGFLAESTAAFRAGERLEPDNKDWPKEIEATEQLRRAQAPALARQLFFNMLPELLAAWVRGAEGAVAGGVLQVQAKGDFKELGAPKWQLLRDTKAQAKAQLRYAYLDRKDYLANLAANLQSPTDGVATVDIDEAALKIAEFTKFLPPEGSDLAPIHIDVQGPGGKMVAVLALVPCDSDMRQKFLGKMKDPPPPKAAVDPILDLQRKSGFPKALPKLLGFQVMPGDLNFPVIDLKRDASGTGA